MNEIASYLRRFPPFNGVQDAEVERAAASAEEVGYQPGDLVLREDGEPAHALYVVRSGSVEIVHDDEVVDVLEPGEVFGHTSLLSAMAPAFDVRAREHTICLAIDEEVARAILGTPAGAEFVAATLRERMVRTGYVAHAQADQRTAHLGSLVHRPAVVVEPDSTVREAARQMSEKDVSCVLVRLDGSFGVVTDSDLRSRLVAAGLSYDTPVRELMVAPAKTFPPDRLAVDAMIDMLDAGIHHLPIVDARGVPLGIVTATDLMYLESRTPFAMRRSIAHADSVEEVVAAAGHLPLTIVTLLRAGVSAVDVGRVMALSDDAATTRLVQLAFATHGDPPVPWAWMALGSVARREQSLASDQDNALAYGDSDQEVDRLFEAVATDVNDGLRRCGFGEDNAEVLARNRRWRMSEREWILVFRTCLEHPDRSHLTRAAVAFDFRHVVGGLNIVRPLVEIERETPNYPDFVRRLARTATDFTPPLGFRSRLALDEDGRFDIKRKGVVPIANLARFHALSAGLTISGTLDRLEGAEAAGALSHDQAGLLREAFELVVRIRLDHQARQVEAGQTPGNRIDPGELPPLTRSQLRDAFKGVAAAQHELARFVPLGM